MHRNCEAWFDFLKAIHSASCKPKQTHETKNGKLLSYFKHWFQKCIDFYVKTKFQSNLEHKSGDYFFLLEDWNKIRTFSKSVVRKMRKMLNGELKVETHLFPTQHHTLTNWKSILRNGPAAAAAINFNLKFSRMSDYLITMYVVITQKNYSISTRLF